MWKIIAFSGDMEGGTIKRMLQLAGDKKIESIRTTPNLWICFSQEEKKRINLKWMERSYSFCLASPWWRQLTVIPRAIHCTGCPLIFNKGSSVNRPTGLLPLRNFHRNFPHKTSLSLCTLKQLNYSREIFTYILCAQLSTFALNKSAQTDIVKQLSLRPTKGNPRQH